VRAALKEKSFLLAPVLFALFIFFIPISPSLKSIFFGCVVAVVLFSPQYNKHIFYAFNSWWGRTALALFAFIVIACLWSPAPYSMQLMVLGKYCKLIYLPVLAAGFINPKTRTWCINSYLAAMLFTCIVSILKANGLVHIGDPGDSGDVFYNHILTGFMMAFAAYLAALHAFKYTGWQRNVYAVLFALMSYQLFFCNTGRTGYIIYFILISLLFLQKLDLKKTSLGVVVLISMILLAYTQSHVMQTRINDLVSDVKFLQHHNPNTSLGFRIQFHDYAHSLWDTHPYIGIGTGGFKYSFKRDNPVPGWGPELTDPHSQYWMTLVEQGVVGLALLILFFISLFITSFKLSETRPILLGILVSFCVGCISDTILCYSTAGYLLVIMSALCFGELLEKRAPGLATESKLTAANDPIDAIPV
jgi:O-antigen ligase